MTSELICADVRQWADKYNGPLFHALLTDCPYEQNFMSRGWDSSGIAFDSSMWAALAVHLHPGAFLFVMAGTLNDDLISIALRQAGLRKFHRMLGWSFGSGFPKATRMPDSEIFSAHRYGGQVLKPALESVLIFNKPYSGKPVDSITATGAGALWIDGGRIEGVMDGTWGARQLSSLGYKFVTENSEYRTEKPSGRWPANFYLTHSPACADSACVDGCSVKAIGEQSGERPTGALKPYHEQHINASSYSFERDKTFEKDFDSGTAARFFMNADWNAETWERLETSDPDRCVLCNSEVRKHDTMSEIQEDGLSCENVKSAKTNLKKTEKGKGSVVTLALQNGRQDSAGKSGKSKSNARGAGKSKQNMQATSENIVAPNAPATEEEKLLRAARSAVSLCASCEIAIVQSLALMRQGQNPESLPIVASMPERKRQTFLQSLVLNVDYRGNIDITQTILNLKELFGYAPSAIEDYTRRKIEHAPPVFYSSKAGRGERGEGLEGMPIKDSMKWSGGSEKMSGLAGKYPDGTDRPPQYARNSHPTVKPIALTRWLATLLLPPTAYAPRRLLVPFAGVASEMIGAHLAGWEEITGIELDPEHVDIGRARLEWWGRQMSFNLGE